MVNDLHAVLGNHDYRGNVEAQLSPFLREIDSRWLCLRSYIVDSGIFLFIVNIFFVACYFQVNEMLKNHVHVVFFLSNVYFCSCVELVEIFFVDTTPFVEDYFLVPEHHYDWKGINPPKTYLANLLKV